ncbi:MAG: hypothetical protein E6K55_07730 [Gemmatimonadetes bacterium]|nr:MAG: hypothetical protein DMD67_08680 [Gemmatimonadota bacterium]TLY53541.1 MAG: hypothetical protein E6K55_07730 [Gemmatimonadota bacterium]
MRSMGQRPPALRALWLATALLQLTLPGAAAWADARLDTAESHAVAHIESHTTNSCARIHAPDCALCHFLTAPVAVGRAVTLPVAGADHRLPGRIALAGLPYRLSRPHPQPRAPPALS